MTIGERMARYEAWSKKAGPRPASTYRAARRNAVRAQIRAERVSVRTNEGTTFKGWGSAA